MVRDLMPRLDTYPELARSLRLNLASHVDGRLPRAIGEPPIGLRFNGTGQLPTIGRAALFETLRRGSRDRALLSAIGALAEQRETAARVTPIRHRSPSPRAEY
jgi:hypothetical protein